MPDDHLIVTLTWRTPAPGLIVLQDLLASIALHAPPYELVGAHLSRYDANECDDDGR